MDKLFLHYSITEIEEKTRISPVVLKKLKDYDFEGISKVKLQGFIKILETEYPEHNFEFLKQRIEDFYSSKDIEKVYEENSVIEKNNSFKMYMIVVLLIAMIIGLIYYMQSQKQTEIIAKKPEIVKEINTTIKNPILKDKNDKEENISPITVETEENLSELKEDNEENSSFVEIEDINESLVIKPIQKVWFKVYNLDDDTSKEYLTSKEVELNGTKRSFIKFGHGQIKIFYNNKEIFPNTKKIVRVIIENGDVNFTTKRIGAFR